MTGKNYGKNVDNHSINRLNAIAYGVDARIDYFDFHSRIVTERTAQVARWFSLPEREIERWTVSRDKLNSDRNRRLQSSLNKLKRNAIAQVMLGFTRLVYQFPQSGDEKY